MALKLYGVARSRASRNIWFLGELGEPYERVPVIQGYRLADAAAPGAPLNTESPAFRAVCPTGLIPCLEEDGFVLFESLAINLHLARTRGGALGPAGPKEEAEAAMWSLWAATACEPHAVALLYEAAKPEGERGRGAGRPLARGAGAALRHARRRAGTRRRPRARRPLHRGGRGRGRGAALRPGHAGAVRAPPLRRGLDRGVPGATRLPGHDGGAGGGAGVSPSPSAPRSAILVASSGDTSMALSRRTLAPALLVLLAGPAAAQQKFAVGAYPSNPPFEFKNEKGEFEGFETEIAREVAKRLGLGIEIADLGFQALFAATASGRIDAAISSITVTPERVKSQAFTQPYYDADLGVAAKKAGAFAGLDDLKGKNVGVLSTSTGDKWARDNQARYGVASVRGYGTQNDMLLDLANGRLDAVVSDVPGMEYSFLKMTDLAVRARIKTGEQYAMMLRKGHPLAAKASEAIGAMKADGTMAAIHKKWFGTDAPADSSTLQARAQPAE